jgi:hypothetical protein
VNVGNTQARAGLPDVIRKFRLHGGKERRTGRESAAANG